MKPSPIRAETLCRQRAILAVLLAMMLAWVGGSRTGTQLGSLGEADDHGLVGASLEWAQVDSMPAGKTGGEASSEEPEREGESENDSDDLLAHGVTRTLLESVPLADRSVDEANVASVFRARRLLAITGARGPPVG